MGTTRKSGLETTLTTTSSEDLDFLRDLAAEAEIKASWKHTELSESLGYLRDDPTQPIWPNVAILQQELIELKDRLYSLRQQIHDLEEACVLTLG